MLKELFKKKPIVCKYCGHEVVTSRGQIRRKNVEQHKKCVPYNKKK